jgi:uncharacterized protein (TIGR00730 family)|tara:strand:- start:416 stop:988 length:573 start_codon:yes stop_codon:yes gene_type:complete
MKKLCVFCGASMGRNPAYAKAARSLARSLATNGITLVYGGASVGIMGQLADAALEAGGQVIGVMPQELVDREVSHLGLTELKVVGSMHERKAMMAELSDGFIALPGGLGTLEELFEVLTWAQLRFHSKPCGLLNAVGYYDRLISFLDHSVDEKFIKPAHREMLIVNDDPMALLRAFETYSPPSKDKLKTN